MAFLGSWSSEVFACISGLIGIVSGMLIGQGLEAVEKIFPEKG